MFHKIKEVYPKNNYILQAVFTDGVEKEYDIKPLFSEIPEFEDLQTVTGLFRQVKVDIGGYAVIWNNRLDLSAEEIWEHGKTLENA